jgi:hypothetical protein
MSTLPNPNDGYWYGGAAKVTDAKNVAYLGGIAARDKLSTSDPARFRFEVHRMGSDGSLTWLPLEDGDLSGRGGLYIDLSTGQGRYSCTNGKTSYDGPIPGFAPLPTPGALQSQIDALEAIIAGLPPTTTGPIIYVPARNAADGGQVLLGAGAGNLPWSIEVAASGNLRFVRGGVVFARWP